MDIDCDSDDNDEVPLLFCTQQLCNASRGSYKLSAAIVHHSLKVGEMIA